MNGLKFAQAVTHILNHKLATIFEGLSEPYGGRLQEREITAVEIREAMITMLMSVIPDRDISWVFVPYQAILHDGAGPDEACQALRMFFELLVQDERDASTDDLRTRLMDDAQKRDSVANMTRQFFACLVGEPLPTHEERQAEKARQAHEEITYLHATHNWGVLMYNADNILTAAAYLQSFPEAERAEALRTAILRLYKILKDEIFHAERSLFHRKPTSSAEEAGFTDKRCVTWEMLCRVLQEFCAENAYRPPSEEG